MEGVNPRIEQVLEDLFFLTIEEVGSFFFSDGKRGVMGGGQVEGFGVCDMVE